MEQEIESIEASDKDLAQGKSNLGNPAAVDIPDEAICSGKALEETNIESEVTKAVDEKIADDVSDSKIVEIPEKESVEPTRDSTIEEIPTTEETQRIPESKKTGDIVENPEADEPEDKSPEDVASPPKKDKELSAETCTDLGNLSLGDEKSQTSSIQEPQSSSEAKETLDLPKETEDNRDEGKIPDSTVQETTAEIESAVEAFEEDDKSVESSSKDIVEKVIPDFPEEAHSGEETSLEDPLTEETSKKNVEESVEDPLTEESSEKNVEESVEDPLTEESSEKNVEESVEEAESLEIEEPSKFSETEKPPLESETKKSGEDSKSDSESTGVIEIDSPNKEINSEKQIVEPENTEFVQISQDKQDDVANESQSIDAEDPFGGDNITADNVEQVDVDSQSTDVMNFHKLGDQAVNLQDVVNAKDQESGEFTAEDSNLEDALDVSVENPEIVETNPETVTSDASEKNDDENDEASTNSVAEKKGKDTMDDETIAKAGEEKSSEEPMLVDSSNEAGDDEEDDGKKKNDGVSMETEDSQSNVLPGQDDELCIIPDSMKETSVGSSEAAKATEAAGTDTAMEKSSEDKDNDILVEREVIKHKDSDAATSSDVTMTENDQDPMYRGKERKKNDRSVAKASSESTDVIDVIDEEMRGSEIDEMPISDELCKQCEQRKACGVIAKLGSESFNVCSQACKTAFINDNDKSMDIPSDAVNSKREKRCASCLLIVETNDDRNLSWETMEFCNEECLGKFQMKYGSYCRNCKGSVQPISLGKYCVRFGYDVRQFCCSSCLEEFKKGLKVCSYCQKDISSGIEGFLAPVGDKGQFKDFCTQYCMEKYSRMNSTEPVTADKKSCSVCQEVKVVHCEVQIDRAAPVAICSDPCFAAFKFVNKVDPEQCSTCKKFFELASKKSIVVFFDTEAHTFCNKTCLNIFIITNRKIVPCNWCKVKKYNFDMIKKDLKTGQALMMCSLNCLTLYQVSVNAVSAKRISCDFCKEFSQAQYHLTMSDATIRNFCSYNCVMKFQGQYTKSPITIPSSDDPVPTGMPKRTYPPAKGTIPPIQKPTEITSKKAMPVISSVTSLASLTSNGQVSSQGSQQQCTINNASVPSTVVTNQTQTPQVIVNQQVITRPPTPVKIHNKMTQCKPLTHTKGVSVRPHPCPKSTQTDGDSRVLIPIPVPIYVPFPVHMWSMPFPVPVPFPLPIPVPIFIPTTRNSTKGIFKDIKRIQEKIPADPFEAELLMMAEMVATEKKNTETDSDSSDDTGRDAAEPVDSSNTFGEDMLQMALKMATGELDEPAVDLETALTPNTITATQAPSQGDSAMNTDVQPERNVTASNRGKKRMVPYKPRGAPSKRGRRISGVHDVPMMPPPESQPPSQPRMMEPIEKPDANMALKYTFGVNAWRQWVITKNAELEKQITPTRKVKLFKTDLLQLTADELNYTLCLFVKEVRKPNGAEYAPDTIYYLCLGIQQYLFENNRIDNIFTDSYYEKFTDCLNDVAKKFSVLYNDAQYIVTRVEEEHLWECKQLGAHSPHVLLSTLMFFNTKHFNLVTVEEHMQLSFSHIMKHWKRNPAAQAAATAVAGKGPGTRNVLLRFYPPQSALEANSRKKKVYEQQENEENPLRCPVKLYEFYLSKCPESVKTRNDVFYLLPERSCVPDSPVWYSTSALAKEHLVKMLYRVKMVKEINVALLTS